MLKQSLHIAAAKYSNKKWIIALAVAATIAVSCVVLPMLLNGEPEEYTLSRNVFLDNITINGIDIGGMTYNDALDAIVLKAQQAQSNWALQLVCNDFTYSTITYDTIGSNVDYGAIEAALYSAWTYGHTGDYKAYLKDVEALAASPFDVNVERRSRQSLYIF